MTNDQHKKVKELQVVKNLHNVNNDDKLIYAFQPFGGVMPMHIDEFLDDDYGYLEEYGTAYIISSSDSMYSDIVDDIIDLEISDIIDNAPTIGQSQENKIVEKIKSRVKFVIIDIEDDDTIGFVADGYENELYSIVDEMLKKFERANKKIRSTENITDYWFR